MKNLIFNSHTRIHLFRCLVAGLLLATLPAIAQDAPSDMPEIPPVIAKRLAARASNVDEVTLNKTMLNFAGLFMNSKNDDDREGRQIIKGLNGIYVRNYEFNEPGAYTDEDLKTIRRQFLGPQWNPMVHSRSKNGGDNSDVYVKMVNNKIDGMFVLSAEPKELSLVYISGTIDPKDLGQLGGKFGIPNINTGNPPNPPNPPAASAK